MAMIKIVFKRKKKNQEGEGKVHEEEHAQTPNNEDQGPKSDNKSWSSDKVDDGAMSVISALSMSSVLGSTNTGGEELSSRPVMRARKSRRALLAGMAEEVEADIVESQNHNNRSMRQMLKAARSSRSVLSVGEEDSSQPGRPTTPSRRSSRRALVTVSHEADDPPPQSRKRLGSVDEEQLLENINNSEAVGGGDDVVEIEIVIPVEQAEKPRSRSRSRERRGARRSGNRESLRSLQSHNKVASNDSNNEGEGEKRPEQAISQPGTSLNTSKHSQSGKDSAQQIPRRGSKEGLNTSRHCGDKVNPGSSSSGLNIARHSQSGKDPAQQIPRRGSKEGLNISRHSGDKVNPGSSSSGLNISRHSQSGKDSPQQILRKGSKEGLNISRHSGDKVNPGSSSSGLNISRHSQSGKDSAQQIPRKGSKEGLNTSRRSGNKVNPGSSSSGLNISKHSQSGKDSAQQIVRRGGKEGLNTSRHSGDKVKADENRKDPAGQQIPRRGSKETLNASRQSDSGKEPDKNKDGIVSSLGSSRHSKTEISTAGSSSTDGLQSRRSGSRDRLQSRRSSSRDRPPKGNRRSSSRDGRQSRTRSSSQDRRARREASKKEKNVEALYGKKISSGSESSDVAADVSTTENPKDTSIDESVRSPQIPEDRPPVPDKMGEKDGKIGSEMPSEPPEKLDPEKVKGTGSEETPIEKLRSRRSDTRDRMQSQRSASMDRARSRRTNSVERRRSGSRDRLRPSRSAAGEQLSTRRGASRERRSRRGRPDVSVENSPKEDVTNSPSTNTTNLQSLDASPKSVKGQETQRGSTEKSTNHGADPEEEYVEPDVYRPKKLVKSQDTVDPLKIESSSAGDAADSVVETFSGQADVFSETLEQAVGKGRKKGQVVGSFKATEVAENPVSEEMEKVLPQKKVSEKQRQPQPQVIFHTEEAEVAEPKEEEADYIADINPAFELLNLLGSETRGVKKKPSTPEEEEADAATDIVVEVNPAFELLNLLGSETSEVKSEPSRPQEDDADCTNDIVIEVKPAFEILSLLGSETSEVKREPSSPQEDKADYTADIVVEDNPAFSLLDYLAEPTKIETNKTVDPDTITPAEPIKVASEKREEDTANHDFDRKRKNGQGNESTNHEAGVVIDVYVGNALEKHEMEENFKSIFSAERQPVKQESIACDMQVTASPKVPSDDEMSKSSPELELSLDAMEDPIPERKIKKVALMENEKREKQVPVASANPGMDLLGFLGSNYQDVIDKDTNHSAPVVELSSEPKGSVDFFQSLSTHPESSTDNKMSNSIPAKKSRAKKLMEKAGSIRNIFGGEDRQIEKVQSFSSSVESAGEEDAKMESFAEELAQKPTQSRKIRRAKPEAINEGRELGLPPPSLAPPSLAGNLVAKKSRTPKKVERVVKAADHKAPDSPRGLAPPSLAGDLTYDRKKVRRVKRSTIYGSGPPAAGLAPPSLAGDDELLRARRGKLRKGQRPERKKKQPESSFQCADHSYEQEGEEVELPLEEKLRKVRRKKPNEQRGRGIFDQSLAPPSLAGRDYRPKKVVAPPSLAGDGYSKSRTTKQSKTNRPTTASETVEESLEEDARRKITNREVAKAKSFAMLSCDDDNYVGDIVPEMAETKPKKMTRRGMLRNEAVEESIEEDARRRVTKREMTKAKSFSMLSYSDDDDDDDDDDSVGNIVPEMAETKPKKMSRRGMLEKAKSALNVVEKTSKTVVKKAVSSRNLFGKHTGERKGLLSAD